mgnify:FL=1
MIDRGPFNLPLARLGSSINFAQKTRAQEQQWAINSSWPTYLRNHTNSRWKKGIFLWSSLGMRRALVCVMRRPCSKWGSTNAVMNTGCNNGPVSGRSIHSVITLQIRHVLLYIVSAEILPRSSEGDIFLSAAAMVQLWNILAHVQINWGVQFWLMGRLCMLILGVENTWRGSVTDRQNDSVLT